MTNRQLMINLLLDDLEYSDNEIKFERIDIDDGGASLEAMIYYNIRCPYFHGDSRCKCKDLIEIEIPSREMCVECRSEWLDSEVDE